MSAFMPRDPTPTQKIMVEQLRDGVVSRLILIGVDGAPAPVLAGLSKRMAEQLRAAPELAAVNNGEQVGMEKDFELLRDNRYLLSDAVTPQRFSAAGLRDSLNYYLDLLATPMSGMAQRVLPTDPSGELIHMLEQLQGQAQPLVQDDVWFSGDGSRAMLLAHTRGAGNDIDAQERAMLAIRSAFEEARKGNAEAAGAQVRMTGPGVFSVQSRAAIRDDALRLSIIATLLISCMLLLLYRSPRALALGLFPVASGALAGIAAVSLGFGSVHGLTLGFGITLIGEGVDYAIYLFTQIERNGSPQTTLRRIWPTMRLGVLTSVCGFSAMLFSGFTGLAQLGMFSITGLVVALATSRLVIPHLLPQGFFVHTPAWLGGALMALVRAAPRMRLALFLVVAAALAFLVFKRDAMWNDNLSSMSPIPQEALKLDEQLRRDMGAPDVRYMLVTGADDEEHALQQGEELVAVLRDLAAQGMLQGYDAPPLPSRKAQLARQAVLPGELELRRNMGEALRGMPFRSGTFAPFAAEIAAAKRQPLLDREALQGTALGLKLDTCLVRREEGWSVMLPLRGVKDAPAIERGIGNATEAPFVLLDMKRETEQMFRDYRHEAASNALLGALGIVVLLFVSLRSFRRVLEISMPLAAAVVTVTALLLLTGHTLSIFHLIGLLLVVAVGSNYTLFFDHRCTSAQDRERTITSLLFANVSTMLGFGLLSFSQSPVLNAIGSTVATGAVLSLVFSAILIVRKDD
ncbi:MAG: MMPL family transporter [Gammaproteobacteria bacterium]|nr:MMPL family transporter [Gammaproteobacteria bacterium]MBU1776758.1 MMPL family transporter [Gammaproteobacteria bacterium]MBU1967940.1 MMPL family transporter [Gammaproteobacteria bacterium]